MHAQPGHGRIYERDLRDLDHLLRAARPQVFEQPLPALPSSKRYARGLILDQGNTGTCVTHALVSKLNGAPVVVGPSRSPQPFVLYDEATALDDIAENDHDTLRQYGTSIRAGCKALVARKLIESYKWTYTVEEILQWMLSGQGGVILGIDWYSWMNTPSSDEGIIRRPSGAMAVWEGGHAIYAFGADKKRGLLDLQQSWGTEWGGWFPSVIGGRQYHGCCRLPLEELERLLKGIGEAVAIIETPYRKRVV